MAARILIVEDEESLTELLRYNLEAAGYDVESAARGDEADLRIREQVPDLVLLDWMLPGLSGMELCRRIRAREDTAGLPVIILTARGEEADRVRGLATGEVLQDNRPKEDGTTDLNAARLAKGKKS